MQHPIQQEVKRWRWEVLQPKNIVWVDCPGTPFVRGSVCRGGTPHVDNRPRNSAGGARGVSDQATAGGRLRLTGPLLRLQLIGDIRVHL